MDAGTRRGGGSWRTAGDARGKDADADAPAPEAKPPDTERDGNADDKDTADGGETITQATVIAAGLG